MAIKTLDDIVSSQGFNTVERCSRCKRNIERDCICCKSHPSAQTSDMYRRKPIGNPDLQMDKGNHIYKEINLNYIMDAIE